jgi:hypothetical protein
MNELLIINSFIFDKFNNILEFENYCQIFISFETIK